MNQNPLISIVIPTFNRAQMIPCCLKSALAQTYENIEILVVDDCSTDNTKQVVKTYIDRRIRYIALEKHSGAQVARNTGIKAAKGSYIAFLDSDNEWLSDKLEKQMRLFMQAEQRLAAVYAGYRETFSNGEYVDHFPSLRGNIYKAALRQWIGDTNTIIVKKSSLINAGLLNENIRAYQEWDLYIRLAGQGEFEYVPELLAIYHHHGQPTISKNPLLNAFGFLDVTNAHKEEIINHCGYYTLSRHYLRVGHHFMLANDTITARKYFIQAFRLAPYSILSLFFIIASSLGIRNYRQIQQVKRILTDYLKS